MDVSGSISLDTQDALQIGDRIDLTWRVVAIDCRVNKSDIFTLVNVRDAGRIVLLREQLHRLFCGRENEPQWKGDR